MHTDKIKISTQAYPQQWEAIKAIAQKEGRLMDAIVGEAFEMLIEQRSLEKTPRQHVMDAFEESTGRYDELYRLLAK